MEPLKITAISVRRTETQETLTSEETILPLSPVLPADLMEDFVRDRTSDRVCHQLALECDRLDLLFRESYVSKFKKHSEMASIIARRVGTLKLLGERLDRVSDRDQAGVEITATARALRLVKDALRSSGVNPETREMIYQDLINRVNNEMSHSK